MIKAFPLQFEASELDKIREVASWKGLSIKAFIHEAIQEKIEIELAK